MNSTPREVVIGIDVVTATTKAVAIDSSGAVVGSASAVTTWDIGIDGEVHTDIDWLTDAVTGVLVETAHSAGEGTRVTGLAAKAECSFAKLLWLVFHRGAVSSRTSLSRH
jgi:sugar (pentulose or hexulose) kinase